MPVRCLRGQVEGGRLKAEGLSVQFVVYFVLIVMSIHLLAVKISPRMI